MSTATKTTVAGPSTKVVTDLVRFSYAHVWEPASSKEGKPKKYSISIIIPKKNKALVAKIKKAIEAAKESGKEKLGGKIPANLKTPLRDGDEEREDDDAYANSYFINATSKTRPGIVDENAEPIMEQDEFYSGCYGRASINFFAFNTEGNKGIAAGLNHVMKLKDGEPLGGRSKAADDFNDGFSLDEEDDDFDEPVVKKPKKKKPVEVDDDDFMK